MGNKFDFCGLGIAETCILELSDIGAIHKLDKDIIENQMYVVILANHAHSFLVVEVDIGDTLHCDSVRVNGDHLWYNEDEKGGAPGANFW